MCPKRHGGVFFLLINICFLLIKLNTVGEKLIGETRVELFYKEKQSRTLESLYLSVQNMYDKFLKNDMIRQINNNIWTSVKGLF